MKVIVGLGNPGPKYAGTRHNVGFDVVDYLAASPACSGFRGRFQAQVAELAEAGEQVLLVKPETFMNLSGRAVRQVLDFYKIEVPDLLVVCDDISLPLGKLRARAKGSHGGQNGLRNIQEQLGTQDYARLRIGIGAPEGDAADYVLSKFRPSERAAAEEAVAEAGRAAALWVRHGIEFVANKVNGAAEQRPPKPKPKPKPADAGGPRPADAAADERPSPGRKEQS